MYSTIQMGLCTISGVQENEHPRTTSLTILGKPTLLHLQSMYDYCMPNITILLEAAKQQVCMSVSCIYIPTSTEITILVAMPMERCNYYIHFIRLSTEESYWYYKLVNRYVYMMFNMNTQYKSGMCTRVPIPHHDYKYTMTSTVYTLL